MKQKQLVYFFRVAKGSMKNGHEFPFSGDVEFFTFETVPKTEHVV